MTVSKTVGVMIVCPNGRLLTKIQARGQNLKVLFPVHKIYIDKETDDKDVCIKIMTEINKIYKGIYRNDDQKIVLTKLRDYSTRTADHELYYLRLREKVVFDVDYYQSKHLHYLDFSRVMFNSNILKNLRIGGCCVNVSREGLRDLEYAANKLSQGIMK